jgi:hypothetical protein
MRRTTRLLVVIFAIGLVAAACGDDTVTTVHGATTTEAPTTTEAAAFELPASPVTAVIDSGYIFGNEFGTATNDDLPFDLGSVTAAWYQTDSNYVVVYNGLDLDETGPLCPGNSIMLPSMAYEHISNAPTPGGSCEGAPTIAEPPLGVHVCQGVVSYITAIPAGTDGTLYASIEIYPGTGTNYGATGMVEADPANMPVIDPAILDC